MLVPLRPVPTKIAAAVLAILGAAALSAGNAATGDPESALRACAAIGSDAERLTCYDKLAGRSAPLAAAPVAPRAAVPAAPAAVTAPPAAAPPVAQTFGSYKAEHPQPASAAAPALEAHVTSVTRPTSGHMTVQLEGGAMWELEDGDPFLAAGDTVTITRAALGSYILHAPHHRDHRAHRLR
jgi:hypothetical protein